MNKTALHKILAIILICAVCLSCGVYAFASESEKAPNNNVVNLACKTVVDYEEANGYYDVTQVSGEITNIEQVSGGVNAYVTVNYCLAMKAKTADEWPYIQGMIEALETLTDEEEIAVAETYLNIWRAEIERDHIGKEIPVSQKFKVFIPVTTASISTQNERALNRLSLDEAVITLREPTDFACDDGAEARSSATDGYVDQPLSYFEQPSVSSVKASAFDAVLDVAKNPANNPENRADAISNTVRSGNWTQEERAQQLDRVDAASYARDEDNFPNGKKPDGSNYVHYSGDCANFVSQCYLAGGFEEDPAPRSETSDWYMYSYAWRYAGYPRGDHYGIRDYMEDNGVVFDAGNEWNRAFAGSIMYYGPTLTNGAHVGIITSNNGVTAYYSAHTTDHCHEKLTTGLKNGCDFYIPCWDSHTNSWTPQ